MPHLKHPLIIALILSLLALGGCSKDEVEEDLEATELEYYTSAQSSLRAGNYTGAIQKLQLLEARFPFGRYAEQAQLELIFAYFKSAQPEAARAAADRFIRLHPQHPNIDYAYYLRGLVNFERDRSFLANFVPMDPSTRDPGAARDSFNDFAQLLRRYPNSEYAPDAQVKMKYLRNLLAAAEVNIGRYYIKRGAYVAAANRGRFVFENFQESIAVPDALALMVEAYQLLEMNELAAQTLTILTTNYPGHESLDNDGNFRKSRAVKDKDRSWLNIISFGLIG